MNLGFSVLCRGLGRDHGSVVTIVHLRGGWTSQPQFVKFANALWEPSGGEVYKRNVWIMKGVMAEFPRALNPLTSAQLTTHTVLPKRVWGGWTGQVSLPCEHYRLGGRADFSSDLSNHHEPCCAHREAADGDVGRDVQRRAEPGLCWNSESLSRNAGRASHPSET